MSNRHYVTNADFLHAIKEYRQSVHHARENGLPKPRVSNYIGDCILKIANHLSYKPNFINYTYREEMISDGVENCLMYIDNFDPDKSTNPFAYFTQIIYYAFIRRIQKEKKQTLIKGKLIVEMPFEMFDVQDQDGSDSFISSYRDYIQNSGLFEEILEKDEKKTKKRKADNPIDNMFDVIEDECE